MQLFRTVRYWWFQIRHGWISITIFYVVLTALAYAGYHYCQRLPEADGLSAVKLWSSKGDIIDGLKHVWFIFAWGFAIQSLLQFNYVVRRKQREGNFGDIVKRGVWISTHAGFFEEVIFRVYLFLSLDILLRYANSQYNGAVKDIATHAVLPAANFVTLGYLHPQLTSAKWALGMAVVIGSFCFSSAHRHYKGFSYLNVWAIGLVMFWLMFNYGLITAILAHALYDVCVYAAIALSSPLQPRIQYED